MPVSGATTVSTLPGSPAPPGWLAGSAHPVAATRTAIAPASATGTRRRTPRRMSDMRYLRNFSGRENEPDATGPADLAGGAAVEQPLPDGGDHHHGRGQ